MLTNPSSRQCGILYIDDEEKALKYFRLAFAQKFEIFTAPSGPEGLEILRRESAKIAIVISDQRMPEMLGAEILEIVRNEYPHVVRILTTAYSDLESAIQAVNRGHIYQYVVKPWEVPELGMVLQRASDYHQVLSERDELLAVKLSTLQRVLCSDRVKWLLLASRAWAEEERIALRRTVVSLIEVLPSQLNPAQTRKVAGVSARDFDLERLISGEYSNATMCLDAIDALRGASGSWSERATTEVSGLAAALAAGLEVAEDSIETEASGLAASVALDGAPIEASELARALGGVLAEKESGAIAVNLLRTLFALAMAGGKLVVTGGGMEFRFLEGDAEATSAADVIAALHGQFSRADLAGLRPTATPAKS